MTTKYIGGFITKSPVAPTTSAASGIWTAEQALQYTKAGTWPRSPSAPTIGTATAGAAGSGAATVSFTAPSDLGTGTISYTATSSPSGGTGTGSSPITVTGLTNGTAYTFTVTATNANGTSAASAASNSVTPVSIYYFTLSTNTDITNGIVGTDTANSRTMFAGGYSNANIFPVSASGNPSAGVTLPVQVSNDAQVKVSGSNVYLVGAGGSGNFNKIRALKLNTSLSIVWQRELVSSQANMYASQVAVGDSDAVYVGGTNQSNPSPPDYRCWVGKWNSSGTIQWYKEMSNSFSPGSGGQMRAIAWNGSSICISSSFQADFEGGGQPVFTRINAAGTSQVAYPVSWTAKNMVANGTALYAATDGGTTYSINSTATPISGNWGRTNSTSIDGVTVDSSGNVYVVASLTTPFNCIEIYKFDSSGNLQWQRRWRDSTSDVGLFNCSISIAAEGQIAVRFIQSGNYKWAVLAVNPDGSGAGTYSLGGKSWIYSVSTRTISNTGNPSFSGSTNQYNDASRSEGAASLSTSAYTVLANQVGL